jgi:hypothetical protein
LASISISEGFRRIVRASRDSIGVGGLWPLYCTPRPPCAGGGRTSDRCGPTRPLTLSVPEGPLRPSPDLSVSAGRARSATTPIRAGAHGHPRE